MRETLALSEGMRTAMGLQTAITIIYNHHAFLNRV
jgi:hypothetical protein